MKKLGSIMLAVFFFTSMVYSVAVADPSANATVNGGAGIKAMKTKLKADKAKVKADKAMIRAAKKAKWAKMKAAIKAKAAMPVTPAGAAK